MNADSQDSKIRSRFFGSLNPQIDTSPLASVAQKHLATPSASIKSESAFSISAYYERKQRARSSSTNIGFSVFLKDKLSLEID